MLIDGKKTANEIQAEIRSQIGLHKTRKPGLAVLLVGDNPASHTYVKYKRKACAEVGIVSTVIELAGSISESDLLKQIEKLNQNPAVDGILVQLPLPSHIDEKNITSAIDPLKDIDGFHPINVGKMLLGIDDGFFPCTPLGIKVLLEKHKIPVEGKHIVIVGRSNIVGKPLAAILMQKKPHCNATVTVAHSQSENLQQLTKSADILIAALGRPLFIKKEMVKPKSTIIDVGINRMPNGKLIGDVDFDEVSKVAGHITPVPGGIGPMTIAMLLQNTFKAFLKTLLVLFLFASCSQSPKDLCTHFEGTEMARPYQITVGKILSAKEKRLVEKVIQETFLDARTLFDNNDPGSEISKLNSASANTLIPLSKPLQDLLTLCDKIVSLSGGRFDPTVEPLEKLWKQTPNPTVDALQNACDATGWEHICIHNGIFKKDRPETALDLLGVSKGLCVDWIVERLEKLGFSDLLVKWSGEIRGIGHHPENRDWSVEVDPSLRVNEQPMAPLPLRDCAISTCVNRGYMIDPLTASPLYNRRSEAWNFERAIASVTVIAPTCALADALATAAMVFQTRSEAEKWAQEIVDLYPNVSFWILSHRDDR